MEAVQLAEPGKLRLVSIAEAATPSLHEARVRICRVGICGTDLHAFAGRQPFFEYPRILGHELGVEVLDVGSAVVDLKEGDRCAVEPYLNCERCTACRRGRPNCCESLQVLGVHVDGGLCGEITIAASKLHRSSRLEFDQLALVETLGIGANAVDRAEITASDTVLVVGAGPIGLGVAQFALARGATVYVVDRSASRRSFCDQALPVAGVLGETPEILQQVRDLTNGDLFTAVFDATGNAQAMAESFEYVAHAGKLIFVGIVLDDIQFYDPLFHRREMTLYASRNSRPELFKEIITSIERGKIDTRPWITHRTGMAGLIDALPDYAKPDSGVVKAMVTL